MRQGREACSGGPVVPDAPMPARTRGVSEGRSAVLHVTSGRRLWSDPSRCSTHTLTRLACRLTEEPPMNPNGTTRTGFVASIIVRRITPTDSAGLERFYAELSDD